MNKRQRIAVIVGMLVALCMLAYPPWNDHHALLDGQAYRVEDRGYAPLFDPPPIPESFVHSMQISWERLLLQIGIVAIATGIAFVAMGGDKEGTP